MSLKDHLNHLQIILQLLRENQLFAKRSKCDFTQNKMEYLGHVISGERVGTDPSKATAVLDWPQPKTIKDLRGFLGLTDYYRKFVKGYAQLSKPLIFLLKMVLLNRVKKKIRHFNS